MSCENEHDWHNTALFPETSEKILVILTLDSHWMQKYYIKILENRA